MAGRLAVDQQRDRIVREARSWIGTPYRLGARVKGAGADCATLLLEVYRACGLITDDELGVFAGDWWLHTTEERYLLRVLRHAHLVAETIAYRSSIACPGDIVLARAAKSRLYNHGGIVTAWPLLVHAAHPTVAEIDASTDRLWAYQQIAIFDPTGHGESGGTEIHQPPPGAGGREPPPTVPGEICDDEPKHAPRY